MNWLQMLAGGGNDQQTQITNPYQAQMALQNAQMQKQQAQQMMQPQYSGGGASGIVAGLLGMLQGKALDRRADEGVSQALQRTFEYENQAAQQAAAAKQAEEDRKFQRELERDRKKYEEAAKNRAKTNLDYLPEQDRPRAARIGAGLELGAQAPQQGRQPTALEIQIGLAKQMGATPEQLQQIVIGGGSQAATPERREEAKLQTGRIKEAEERARAAEKTLANVAQLEKLMESGLSTGPLDRFLPGADRGLFDAAAADLNLSTLRQNFGGNPTEGERTANAATLPGTQQYESNNRQLLAKLRAEAEAKIQQYQQLVGGGATQGAAGVAPAGNPDYQSVMAKYGL